MSDGATVTFELFDRSGRLQSVRLWQEVGLRDLDFGRRNGIWQLEAPCPAVDRMEYLFEIADHNGHRATILDPANTLRAPGAFGEKSVREFAQYRRPRWLEISARRGLHRDLDTEIPATVWSSDGLDDDRPAPLLVVHDGPEYAELGAMTRYLAAMIAAGELPPLRAALLGPGDRNDWYSADPGYARLLCADVMPLLPPATVRVGVGVSLGGLALLHAHRCHPGVFDALFLQSSSFFSPVLDPQESGFGGFAAVTDFVAGVAAADGDPAPVPTVLTCGTVEENRANNEAMTAHLQRLGYEARLVLVRDAHNYTAWRDALDPHLTRLVQAVSRAS